MACTISCKATRSGERNSIQLMRAGFIRDVVEDPGRVKTKGVVVKSKTLEEEAVEVTGLVPWTFEEVRERVREKAAQTASQAGPEPLSKL